MSLTDEASSGGFQDYTSPNINVHKPAFTRIKGDFHIQVLDKLGKGAYGEVFSVRRYEDGKIYAMKALNVSDSNHRKYADWEVSIGKAIQANGLTHYLVGVHCSLTQNNHVYFVMEKLELDLWKFISQHHKNKPFNLLQVRNVAWQLLTAVEILHSMGIIHSDIKPENVLVIAVTNDALKIKLSDFGTALRVGYYTCAPKIQSLFYRSPEVLYGLPFDEKIDIWSVGCIMIEMYLGVPFYPAENELQLAQYITNTQGYPFDLGRGKHWNKYFERKCTFYEDGKKEVKYILRPMPIKTRDRRLHQWKRINSILEHGFSWRSFKYISVLDNQFVNDLPLLMGVDRDWRCNAEEAKSLALFQMEPTAIHDEYVYQSYPGQCRIKLRKAPFVKKTEIIY